MKKDTPVIIGLCIILLGISGILFWRGQSRTAYTGEQLLTASPTEASQQISQKEEAARGTASGECAVYISGAVKHPGIYRYQGTARVCDAIEAVGGFQKGAATDLINLARVLQDGEQICVLTKKEAVSAKKEAGSTGAKEGQSGNSGDKQSSQKGTDGKININTATEAELMTLPGIGEAKAALILNYRKENGSFTKIEDLMQISGIKEGIFQKIKDDITIS